MDSVQLFRGDPKNASSLPIGSWGVPKPARASCGASRALLVGGSLAALAIAAMVVGLVVGLSGRSSSSGSGPVAQMPSQFWIRYYNGSSTTKIQISFAASVNDASATVTYGSRANVLNLSAGCSTASYVYPAAGYASPFIYTCILDAALLGTSFLPGSKLFYQVAASALLTASPVASFPTHPGVGVPDVVLALLGDLGTTGNSSDTVSHMAADPDPISAVVHVGDLSYADGAQVGSGGA